MLPVAADFMRHVLEAALRHETEPPRRVALALQLVTLAVSHLFPLTLAELAQSLNVNTVFPEFLFHRQSLIEKADSPASLSVYPLIVYGCYIRTNQNVCRFL